MSRLATHIWIDALIRRVQFGGASAFILQKGDRERGDVLVKVSPLDGRAAFLTKSPMSGDEPEFDWQPVAGGWAAERDVDETISRRRGYDPDLWVVEIEDREGRHFLTEKVNGECGTPGHGGNP